MQAGRVAHAAQQSSHVSAVRTLSLLAVLAKPGRGGMHVRRGHIRACHVSKEICLVPPESAPRKRPSTVPPSTVPPLCRCRCPKSMPYAPVPFRVRAVVGHWPISNSSTMGSRCSCCAASAGESAMSSSSMGAIAACAGAYADMARLCGLVGQFRNCRLDGYLIQYFYFFGNTF